MRIISSADYPQRVEWLAGAHREVLDELTEWWEYVVAGKGSYLVQVPVDPDWGERRALRALINELIERQPAGERFFGLPTRGRLRPTVEDPSAMPSFIAFAVTCATGSGLTQPDLVEFQQQLSAWQRDLRAVPETSAQGERAVNQIGLEQLQAAAEVLAPFARSAAIGPALTAASVGRVGYQSARAFQRRYNIYDLDTRRTQLCARSLGHLSRNVPTLLLVEDAHLMSPELLGLVTEMLQQLGARVLVIAVSPRNQIPPWLLPAAQQISSHRIETAQVDAFALRHEAQQHVGTDADHALVESIAFHASTLGALGRMFDTPAIKRALQKRQLAESDVTSWRDPASNLSNLSGLQGRALAAAAIVGPLVPTIWLELLEGSTSDAIQSLAAGGWLNQVTPDLMRFQSESSRLVALDSAGQFLTAEERATIEQGAPDALKLALSERSSVSSAAIWHLAARAATDPDPPVVQIKQAAGLAAESGAFRTAAALADALGHEGWSVEERATVARWRYIAGEPHDAGDPLSVVVNGLLALLARRVGWEESTGSVAAALCELEASEGPELLAWWWFELANRLADHGDTDRAQEAAARARSLSMSSTLRSFANTLIEEMDSGFSLEHRLLASLQQELEFATNNGLPNFAQVSLHEEAFTLAYRLGQWSQARTHATALALARENLLGADHPQTLMARLDLASSCWAEGQAQVAIGIQEQVRAKFGQILGLDHPTTLLAWANLAIAYHATGRTQDAIHISEQVLKARKHALGPDDPQTLTTWANLATLYEASGRAKDAVSISKQVLAAHGTRSRARRSRHSRSAPELGVCLSGGWAFQGRHHHL